MPHKKLIESINTTVFKPANAHDLSERVCLADMIAVEQATTRVLSAQKLNFKAPEVRGKAAWDIKLTGPILINPQPSWFPSKVPTVDFYLSKVKNAVCLPDQVVLKDKNVLLHSFTAWINWSNPKLQADGEGYRLKNPIEKLDRLHGAYLYLDRQHLPHHGHFLLNVISMLWAWDILKAVLPKPPKIIITDKLSSEEINLLVSYGIGAENIVLITTAVYCESLYLATPGYAISGYTSQLAKNAWDNIERIFSKNNESISDKIYVSRLKLRTIEDNSRTLIEEKLVEEIFERKGFKVIYPESMSLEQQIHTFSTASLVAGTSGANMYNMVFQKELKKAFVITSENYITLEEFFIVCSDKKLTLFVGQAQGKDVHSNWNVDIIALENAVDEWLTNSRDNHKQDKKEEQIKPEDQLMDVTSSEDALEIEELSCVPSKLLEQLVQKKTPRKQVKIIS